MMSFTNRLVGRTKVNGPAIGPIDIGFQVLLKAANRIRDDNTLTLGYYQGLDIYCLLLEDGSPQRVVDLIENAQSQGYSYMSISGNAEQLLAWLKEPLVREHCYFLPGMLNNNKDFFQQVNRYLLRQIGGASAEGFTFEESTSAEITFEDPLAKRLKLIQNATQRP